MYADNSQLYYSFDPVDIESAMNFYFDWVDVVYNWSLSANESFQIIYFLVLPKWVCVLYILVYLNLKSCFQICVFYYSSIWTKDALEKLLNLLFARNNLLINSVWLQIILFQVGVCILSLKCNTFKSY